MKNPQSFPRIVAILFLSTLLFHGCSLFNPPIEIVDIYGTWEMEKVSVDIDVSGDNLAQVLAFRSLASIARVALNNELEKQLDSLGATMTFYDNLTYEIALFEEAEGGSWYFDEDENVLTLLTDSLSLDQLNIEKLNQRSLIINWISEEETLQISDTTDQELTVQVFIEAVLGRVEE